MNIVSTAITFRALGLGKFSALIFLLASSGILLFANTALGQSSLRFLSFNDKASKENRIQLFSVCFLNHTVVGLICFALVSSAALKIDSFLVFFKLPTEINSVSLLLTGTITLSTYIRTPVLSLYQAKEEFGTFAFVGVAESVIKFVAAIAVTYLDTEKLITYLSIVTVGAILITIFVYSDLRQRHQVSINFRKVNFNQNKEVLKFAGWTFFGALGFTLSTNGQAYALTRSIESSSLLAAKGISNQIEGVLTQLSRVLQSASLPLIIKLEAAKNQKKRDQVIYLSMSLMTLLMLVTTTPFLYFGDVILKLWLGQPPQESTLFVILISLKCIIVAAEAPINSITISTGRIANFNLATFAFMGTAFVLFFFFPINNGLFYLIPVTEIAALGLLLLLKLHLVRGTISLRRISYALFPVSATAAVSFPLNIYLSRFPSHELIYCAACATLTASIAGVCLLISLRYTYPSECRLAIKSLCEKFTTVSRFS